MNEHASPATGSGASRAWTTCGCEPRVNIDTGTTSVAFCPLHGAAPELLEVVRELAEMKTCDNDEASCRDNSGPYCVTHPDADGGLIARAVRALRKATQP